MIKTIYEVELICEGCYHSCKFWTDEEEFVVGEGYHLCGYCEGSSESTIVRVELIGRIQGEEKLKAYWKELFDERDDFDYGIDERTYIEFVDDDVKILRPHRFVQIKVFTRNLV